MILAIRWSNVQNHLVGLRATRLCYNHASHPLAMAAREAIVHESAHRNAFFSVNGASEWVQFPGIVGLEDSTMAMM